MRALAITAVLGSVLPASTALAEPSGPDELAEAASEPGAAGTGSSPTTGARASRADNEPGGLPASTGSLAPASEPFPTHLVSISIPALTVRALALGYEHHGLGNFLDDRFSVVAIAGIRDTAQNDYAGTTVSTGFGIRYWLTGRAPWSRYRTRGMVGAFAGLRLGMAYSNIRDEIDDERIGASLMLSETLELGYRFAAWGRFEITPSAGIQLRHEFDIIGELPPWTKAAFTLGLTAGYLFD